MSCQASEGYNKKDLLIYNKNISIFDNLKSFQPWWDKQSMLRNSATTPMTMHRKWSDLKFSKLGFLLEDTHSFFLSVWVIPDAETKMKLDMQEL